MADDRRADRPPPDGGPVVAERAFAKVNLTLRVLGRRADGYHELDSLVCFAAVSDRLTFRLGPVLLLRVSGPTAAQAGSMNGNLVMKAARALAERVAGLDVGRFSLVKSLPAAAGLGGGSADAAAALRILAKVNGLDLADARVRDAARETGADVPVCLDLQARWMRGIGDVLSEPVAMPTCPAVLVHPGVAQPTKAVFAALAAGPVTEQRASADPALPADRAGLIGWLLRQSNDLEPPAIALAPAIGTVLAALRAQPGALLARMSGSGSACFALYASRAAARDAARVIATAQPAWWVKATALGAVNASARYRTRPPLPALPS